MKRQILILGSSLLLAAPAFAADSPMAMPALDMSEQPAPAPAPAAEPLTPPAEPAPEVAAPAPAPVAQEAAAPAGEPSRLHLGLHVGVVLPQVATELGTAPGFVLEGGYRLVDNLSVVLGAGYTQPKVSLSSAEDPRLPAGTYTTDTTQRELSVTLGLMYRLLPPGSFLNGYAMAGARSYFLETITQGSAGGELFLENRETSTRFGGVFGLGGELTLGPGAITLQASYGGSKLPHLITGEVQTSAIDVTLGYRLFLL
jgi:hypothetical protein